MEQDGTGVDSRKILRGLWERKWLILLCMLIAGGSALGFSLLQEKKYTAEASLLFRDPGFDQRLFGSPTISGGDAERQAATNVRLVSLGAVADRTAEELGKGLTGDKVSNKVEIGEQGQSDVVSIAATDTSPEFAATLANTFATTYIEFRQQADRAKVGQAIRLVRRQADQLDPDDRNGQRQLNNQLSQLTTLQGLQTGNAELVQRADVPGSASSPDTARNTIIGALLGLFLGTGIALLLERVDRRIREPDELSEVLELPLLGTVPDSRFLAEAPERAAEPLPFSEAESFRMLRTRLRYLNVDRNVRSVVVTSAVPNEGKSTVAWNLAMTAAGSGASVLLVEADLHHPTFAAAVDLAPLPGLAEVLTGQSELEKSIQHVPVPGRSNGGRPDRTLDVLVSGGVPPNPAELLESKEMSHLVEHAEQDYDVVILDTPPVTVLADAIPLMRRASGVVVVSALGQTTRDQIASLKDQLGNLGVTTLGAVANKVEARRGGRGYGYGYGYGYGETPDGASKGKREPLASKEA